MIFDIIALWTGRVLIISLVWLIISLIFYGSVTYLFRYSPAFRFAIFTFITQKRKEDSLRELKLFNGKTYTFSEKVREQKTEKTNKEEN
jgi:hypothetical protein